MLKLRKMAPLMAGLAAVGGMVATGTPADAATHNDKCPATYEGGLGSLCLWYSTGTGSGIWQTDEYVAWSNFSYDYYSSAAVGYDAYHNGNGANESVRNNAHSAEDPGGPSDAILYSLPDLKGHTWATPEVGKLYAIGTTLRNNNASFKLASCSLPVC
jgi:hypothetical protein